MNFQRVLLFFLWSPGMIFSQLTGAYELTEKSEPGEVTVLIISENYMAAAIYHSQSHDFIRTYGGAYQASGDQLVLNVEFDTRDSNKIGKDIIYSYSMKGQDLMLEHSDKVIWKKMVEPVTPLAGCWRITDRLGQDGNLSAMPQGDRKTLKIMSGSRFQWFAINPKTKQFSGTGGGTYTLKDGVYTEKIEFFSRDKTRVGTELSFEATIQGTKWNHKGKSSTGNPVNEIWTKQF